MDSMDTLAVGGLLDDWTLKQVRCNPDVSPRLTLGGYEDKVDGFTPISKLFIGGGEF